MALGLIAAERRVTDQRAGDGEAGDLGGEAGEALAARSPTDGGVDVAGLAAGARMIVESGSPVLVVKTVVSVLDALAEYSRTNCLSVTFSE